MRQRQKNQAIEEDCFRASEIETKSTEKNKFQKESEGKKRKIQKEMTVAKINVLKSCNDV